MPGNDGTDRTSACAEYAYLFYELVRRHVLKQITRRACLDGIEHVALIAEYRDNHDVAIWQPSRRFIEPRRVAALAAFLCGDDACDITGTPIAIDGGWLANS